MNANSTNEQFNHCLKNAYSKLLGDENANAVIETVERYNYTSWKIGNVTDDRTIVCAINNQMPIHCQMPEYYAEPNWKILQSQYDRLAYPSLSTDNTVPPIGEDYVRVRLGKSEPEITTGKRNHMDPVSMNESASTELKQRSVEPPNPPESAPSVRSREMAIRAYDKQKRGSNKFNILKILIVALVFGYGLCAFALGYKTGKNKKTDINEKMTVHSETDAEATASDAEKDKEENKEKSNIGVGVAPDGYTN